VRYRLSIAAKRDLAGIWEYIARDSESSADAFVDRLKGRCEMLGRNPHAGRERDDLQSGLRGFPYGEYVILYRAIKTGVRIVRVIHGRRDIASLIH